MQSVEEGRRTAQKEAVASCSGSSSWQPVPSVSGAHKERTALSLTSGATLLMLSFSPQPQIPDAGRSRRTSRSRFRCEKEDFGPQGPDTENQILIEPLKKMVRGHVTVALMSID